MGYLDLARQAGQAGIGMAGRPGPRRDTTPNAPGTGAPGRFLRLARRAEDDTRAVHADPDGRGDPDEGSTDYVDRVTGNRQRDEINESNEKSPGAPPQHGGRSESQLWWRLLDLAHALGGATPTAALRALLRLWRSGARLLAGEGRLHIVTDGVGEALLRERDAEIGPLLRALARDPAVIGITLTGDLPPLRTLVRPSLPCYACRGRAYRQRPDGGWVCATCHPAPTDAATRQAGEER